uniref:DRBM domain-containing protein n=1 Tax=Angiostrongylus cantonensis TaxID=6313 RepID=C7BVS7_ANGCA|nr:hypothetical protein [Angiostrongylus cantonensis]
MAPKGLRRRNRRYEQKTNDISCTARFAFIQKIAEKWGKELKISRTSEPIGGLSVADQFTVHIAFGDVPYIVLGAKGVGRTEKEAESNSAWNLMSFFQQYLTLPTMVGLRRKWANAEKEIEEAVEVCRVIEETMNSEQFCQLRMVPIFSISPPEKAWARLLRLESRRLFAERKLLNSSLISTTDAQNTVLTQHHQRTNAKKRSFDVGDVSDGEGPTSRKRNKSCQVNTALDAFIQLDDRDDYDEDGLHITYISPLTTSSSSSSSVVCLEEDTDNIGSNGEATFSRQLDNAHPFLNIAKSSLSPSSRSTSRSYNNDYIIGGGTIQELSSPGERALIGVHFNVAAIPIAGKVREYRDKYPHDFAALDCEIWRHFEHNRQSDAVFKWKMDVRSILLAEFRTAFPHQNVELFAVGSTINGCGSYNSDMDLCLHISMGAEKMYPSERTYAVKTLHRLNSIIRGKPSLRRIVRRSEVIPAKVPIIKMALHPPYEGLELDVNVNNIAGIYNSHLIHHYSLLDQRFPAVCLLVKHWAITNGIGDASAGSFNSYSLILLVLHYFQCGVKPAVLPNLQYLYPDKFGCMPPLNELNLFQTLQRLPPRMQNNQSIGELLIGFFHYYAAFDFENVAISMRDACMFSRANMAPEASIYRVFIEEPFDGKNTARCVTKSYTIGRIRHAFKQARDAFSKFPPSLQRINVNA